MNLFTSQQLWGIPLSINREDFWDKWAVEYLDQQVSQIEKDAVLEIISLSICKLSSTDIGWKLSIKLEDELPKEDERQRAIRICCHLWDEGKIFYSHRNDAWIKSES